MIPFHQHFGADRHRHDEADSNTDANSHLHRHRNRDPAAVSEEFSSKIDGIWMRL